MNWSKLQRAVFGIFVFLTLGLFLMFQVLGYQIDSNNIREYVNSFGIWAPVVFILLCTLGTFFIPSTPFMIAAGVLFGFEYGLLYTVISGFLSSTIVFQISRKLGKRWAEDILEHRYLSYISEYNKRLESGAIWDMMILRITPIMPFNVLNVLMGISRITTRDYIIGTIIGLIPSNIITVYIGAFLTKIF